jgi:integrase
MVSESLKVRENSGTGGQVMASVKYLPKSANPKARKPYTLRYWDASGQHERSFVTVKDRKDFAVKFEHDSREGTYIDPKLGDVTFSEYAAKWLAQHGGTESTRRAYSSSLKCHINPVIGDVPLRKIGREQLRDLLLADLPSKSLGPHGIARAAQVINAVLGEAQRSKRITDNPARGIGLPSVSAAAQFTMPTVAQLDALEAALPEPMRYTVPLMVGCGLRIGEALAVKAESLLNGTLRITEQKSNATGLYGPLKHRKAGDYRDAPLPVWVAKRKPEDRTGYLFPHVSNTSYHAEFAKAAKQAAFIGTPHTLRHVFASVALSNGIPITDLAKWLGHKNINITYATYGHLVPSSWDRARDALDSWHAEHEK